MDMTFELRDLIPVVAIAMTALVQWGISRATTARLTQDVQSHEASFKEISLSLAELKSDMRSVTQTTGGQSEWRSAADKRLEETRDEVLRLREWRHEMANWAQRIGDRVYLMDIKAFGGRPADAPRDKSPFDAPG